MFAPHPWPAPWSQRACKLRRAWICRCSWRARHEHFDATTSAAEPSSREFAPTNVAVLPPTDEAKEDAAVARARSADGFQIVGVLGAGRLPKNGRFCTCSRSSCKTFRVVNSTHAEFIGILKARPGLEGLAWLDFSNITTLEMEGSSSAPKKPLTGCIYLPR